MIPIPLTMIHVGLSKKQTDSKFFSISGQSHGRGLPVEPGACHGQQE